MKILHILNSDFGNPATMGYRSFKIVEKSPFNINVYCRSNMSEAYSQQVHVPFNFLRTFGRFTQLVLKLTGQSRLYSILREIELYLFNSKATLQIKKSSIVHFFYHDEKLIDYAKSLGKIVVVEGFSHPNFLKRMRSEGVVFDSSNIHSDDHSIPCYEKANMIISPSAWVLSLIHI